MTNEKQKPTTNQYRSNYDAIFTKKQSGCKSGCGDRACNDGCKERDYKAEAKTLADFAELLDKGQA